MPDHTSSFLGSQNGITNNTFATQSIPPFLANTPTPTFVDVSPEMMAQIDQFQPTTPRAGPMTILSTPQAGPSGTRGMEEDDDFDLNEASPAVRFFPHVGSACPLQLRILLLPFDVDTATSQTCGKVVDEQLTIIAFHQ